MNNAKEREHTEDKEIVTWLLSVQVEKYRGLNRTQTRKHGWNEEVEGVRCDNQLDEEGKWGTRHPRLFQNFKFGYLGSHKAGFFPRLSQSDAGLRLWIWSKTHSDNAPWECFRTLESGAVPCWAAEAAIIIRCLWLFSFLLICPLPLSWSGLVPEADLEPRIWVQLVYYEYYPQEQW